MSIEPLIYKLPAFHGSCCSWDTIQIKHQLNELTKINVVCLGVKESMDNGKRKAMDTFHGNFKNLSFPIQI